MADARLLLLLRHGESTWNAEGRWQGWADPPLSGNGRLAAEVVAADLGRFGFQSVVSSDLQRARETAEIIGSALRIPSSMPIADLRERDVGDFTGKVASEIEELYPGWLARSRSGEWIDQPGAEPYGSFLARVLEGVGEAAAGGAPILAVTHGGVLRAISMHLGVEVVSAGNLTGLWVECDADGLSVRGPDFRYGGAGDAGRTGEPMPL